MTAFCAAVLLACLESRTIQHVKMLANDWCCQREKRPKIKKAFQAAAGVASALVTKHETSHPFSTKTIAMIYLSLI